VRDRGHISSQGQSVVLEDGPTFAKRFENPFQTGDLLRRLLDVLLQLGFDVWIIFDPFDLPVHQLKRLVLKSVGILKARDEDGVRALCRVCYG
jgi:hypothetical protein